MHERNTFGGAIQPDHGGIRRQGNRRKRRMEDGGLRGGCEGGNQGEDGAGKGGGGKDSLREN